MRRNGAQLDLTLPARPRWGGRRPGAGRKPGAHPPVPHRPRGGVAQRCPMHVTLKLRPRLPSLRSATLVREVEHGFRGACDRGDFRLVHYSLLSNHAHLIVEAADASALARGMKAIGSRLARAVNRVLTRRGPVLLERFHLRVLRTPLETRRALAYVLLNACDVEETETRAIRLPAFARREPGHAITQHREHVRQLGAPGTGSCHDGFVADLVHPSPERRVPRPEGRGRAVFPTASPPHRHPARLGLFGHDARQAGLADSRLSASSTTRPLPSSAASRAARSSPTSRSRPMRGDGRGGHPSTALWLPGSGRSRQRPERSNPDGTVAAIRTPAKGTGHVPRVARIARAAAPSDLNGLPQRRLRGAARAVRDGTR
jgi:REP element-mobilizing transposase RayT